MYLDTWLPENLYVKNFFLLFLRYVLNVTFPTKSLWIGLIQKMQELQLLVNFKILQLSESKFSKHIGRFMLYYCFFTNIFNLPDKMQVQMKLCVYQYLLFAAICNWVRLSSHDVMFATLGSATAPHLCVWNFGKYTSIYKVTHVLINWLKN
jgi:hypothetical protein